MDRYIKKVHHRINYRELLPFFPGFQSKDFIRSGILPDHFENEREKFMALISS